MDVSTVRRGFEKPQRLHFSLSRVGAMSDYSCWYACSLQPARLFIDATLQAANNA